MNDRCVECGTKSTKKQYVLASRLQGGNFRRAPRTGRSTCCVPCAEEMVAYADKSIAENRSPGTYVGSQRWDLRSVRWALELRKPKVGG